MVGSVADPRGGHRVPVTPLLTFFIFLPWNIVINTVKVSAITLLIAKREFTVTD
jgi:hypothetical protein